MFFINLIHPAPGGDVQIKYILPGAGISLENRVSDFAAVVLDLVRARPEFLAKITQPGGSELYMRQLLYCLKILEGEFLAGAYFFGGAAEGQGLVVSKNNVRAQAADNLADIVIEASHHGRYADHDGHADDDSEHGKRGPHFVGADGVQRHLDYFAVIAGTKHGGLHSPRRQRGTEKSKEKSPCLCASVVNLTIQISTPRSGPAVLPAGPGRRQRTHRHWPKPASQPPPPIV